ncbi:hypothetical protein D3C81_2096030 [compost metagenome]
MAGMWPSIGLRCQKVKLALQRQRPAAGDARMERYCGAMRCMGALSLRHCSRVIRSPLAMSSTRMRLPSGVTTKLSQRCAASGVLSKKLS